MNKIEKIYVIKEELWRILNHRLSLFAANTEHILQRTWQVP